LQSIPERRDGRLPYSGLAGLLSSVGDGEFAATGPLQEEVLRLVAGRAEGGLPHPGAVRWAVLDLFRLLSRSGPLLLVVDEIDTLDAPSGDVLRFVARQVADLPVRMAAAERICGQFVLAGRALCPAPLLAVQLDGLVPPPEPDASYDASEEGTEPGQTVPWWRRRGAGGPA